jgi:hypothetical protein
MVRIVSVTCVWSAGLLTHECVDAVAAKDATVRMLTSGAMRMRLGSWNKELTPYKDVGRTLEIPSPLLHEAVDWF